MKRKLLLRKTILRPLAQNTKTLLTLATFMVVMSAFGQLNIAPLATPINSGGGQNSTGYGPDNYNDLIIPPYGSLPWGWVSTNGWIEYEWTAPQTFNAVKFYKDNRPMSTCTFQYWDGSNFVNFYTYSSTVIDDSVFFPPVTTTRLRFDAVAGSSNPNFREIKVFQASLGPNDAGATALVAPSDFCPGQENVEVQITNFGTNRIDSVQVNWSLNGVFQSSVWHSSMLDTIGGTLPNTANVNLGTMTFMPNQTYNIKAWTALPNNVADTINFNDTLNATVSTAVVGTITASKSIVCSGEPFDLTLSPLSQPSGQQFQWQVSSDNISWSNLTGATTPNLLGHTQTASTYYRMIVTCSGSDTTNSVFVETNATPISGTVTINSALPTGSGNFASFADLLTILNCSGINGPLTVNVVQNSGPYNEQIVFGTVGGTSATNKITFLGNGNTVAFTSSNTNSRGTLMMDGTKNIIFRDLTFDASGTGTHGVAAQLLGSGTEYITFKNCLFKSSTTSTSTFFAGVLIGGTLTGPTTATASPSHITIDSCEVEGGYYSLVLNGVTTGATSVGNVVTNSTFKTFRLYGIFARGQNGLLFENNDVTREDRNDVTTFYAFYLNGESPGTKISKNRFHDSHTQDKSNTTISYPIFLTTTSGTSTNPILFSNNLVYNINGSGTKYGFYLSGICSNINVYHNTFEFGNPQSTTTNLLRGFYSVSGISNFEFKNNIMYIKDGSGGQQHMIYVGTTSTSMDFDNNAYYHANSGSNINFGWWGSNQVTFANWQAAAGQILDQNSNYGDPIFLDPTNGDFTPATAVADNMGANLLSVVPDDIFGIARTTTPDAGAIEYTPLPCLPPFNVNTSSNANSVTSWWMIGSDVDSVKIEWGPVGFQPGTGDSIYTTDSTYTITQFNSVSLNPNECYDVYYWARCNNTLGLLRTGPITICTECVEAQMPYSVFFTSWEPSCFSFSSSGTMQWEHNPANDLAQARFWSFSGQTAFMQTQPVDISVGAWVRFKWAKLYNSAYDDRLYIRVREQGTSNWDTIFSLMGPDFNSPNAQNTLPPASKSDFVESVAFIDPSYIGKIADIEFIGVSAWGPNLYIDEIHVEAVPPCVPPVNLSADSLANGLAVLSWGGFGDKYDIEWGLPGFIPGSGLGLDSVKGITTSPHTLSNLTPGITIQIYVRDTCDLNAWHGPITITVPADHDAAMISLVEPSQVACGDSAMAIELRVANNGLQPITSLPIAVTFSGDFSLVHNHTYTGNIPPGDTVVINAGNVNTYAGGNVDVDIVLSMANDQNPFNDSSMGNSITLLPYEPQFYPPDVVCPGQDTVTLKAMSFTGVGYGWYDAATGGNQVGSGDSVKVPVSGQSTYFLEYTDNADSLETMLAGGSGCGAGNMFDLESPTGVSITGFTIRPFGTSASHAVNIYYVVGSHVGTSQTDWTLIESTTVNATVNVPVRVNLTNPLSLQPNQVYGIYVQHNASYTVGANTFSNADLIFTSGNGNCSAFDYCCTPRTFNGRIHYGSIGCSDVRVPVSYTFSSDTALAVATGTPQMAPSLDVDFDASGSQNGQVYDWDFGDGNSIQTTNPLYTHTYAQGGNYTVTLTVIDTLCGTTDQTTLNLEGVSVENYALVLGANVFPNPSTGIFTLTMDLPSSQSMNIRIVDMLGRQLLKRDYGNVPSGSFTEEFNLSRAARGVYLLEVTTTNGKFTKRVVLE